MVLTCISLMISDVGHLFMGFLGHFYIIFGEMSILSPLPIFYLDFVVVEL